MSNSTSEKLSLAAFCLLLVVFLSGCETKEPAERAGESLDKAGTDLKNAVDPRGPMEKAGSKIDKEIGR